MPQDDRIYGTLGGYGAQTGEYGDAINPRAMTVYTGRGRLRPTEDELVAAFEQRAADEAAAEERAQAEAEAEFERRLVDQEFEEAEDALLPQAPRPESPRPELEMLARRQGAPVRMGVTTVEHVRGRQPTAREAIMAEQRALGVPADGVLGPVTLAARARAARAAEGDRGMVMQPMAVTGSRPLTPEQEQAERGLARAREVLRTAPDGVAVRPGSVTMPEMRVTAQRPAETTDPMLLGLERAREFIRTAPDPEAMLAQRRQERRAQSYADTIAQQARADVQAEEQALARRTADERARELSGALEQAGGEFIDRLQRGAVDTSQYTEAMRRPAQLSPRAGARSRELLGQLRGGSDERARLLAEGLGQSDAAMSRQLSSGAVDQSMVRPYTYEYAAGAGPAGRRAGVMAQDLQASGPLGAAVVRETPAGKMVDAGQLSGLNAAQIGRLNERLRKLEGR